MSEEAELEEDEGSGRRRGIKTLRDVQKVQLEKLMANPVSIYARNNFIGQNLNMNEACHICRTSQCLSQSAPRIGNREMHLILSASTWVRID